MCRMGAIIIISTPSADVQNRERGYSPGNGAGAQNITAVPTMQAFSSYPKASSRLSPHGQWRAPHETVQRL